MLLVLWAVHCCWRNARDNQRLSLSDLTELSAYRRASQERRALLLPLSRQRGGVTHV